MSEGMKAGPELDARLCELLEPMPRLGWRLLVYKDDMNSRAGFWRWQVGGARWYPIPVSTDWAAMGKVIDELEKRDLHMHFYCLAPKSGSDLKHALALAAAKALEKKREAV